MSDAPLAGKMRAENRFGASEFLNNSSSLQTAKE
jgi:hypothetical protein